MAESKKIVVRNGTVHGTKHAQLHINNQDACLSTTFRIPALNTSYAVGLVSDGCTGIPRFSRTEVGSNLLVTFAYSRIQEFICAGIPVADIPRSLFQAVTEFIRDLTLKIMPSHIHWPYPSNIKGRETYTGTRRFQADYLSATLLGFITDHKDLVTFSSGDGIIMVDNMITVIDQNDRPSYPSYSINDPGQGFDINVYGMEDVTRLAIMTDGPKELLKHDKGFLDRMFTHLPMNPLGLDILLKVTATKLGHLMHDDCTAVTLEKKVSS